MIAGSRAPDAGRCGSEGTDFVARIRRRPTLLLDEADIPKAVSNRNVEVLEHFPTLLSEQLSSYDLPKKILVNRETVSANHADIFTNA